MNRAAITSPDQAFEFPLLLLDQIADAGVGVSTFRFSGGFQRGRHKSGQRSGDRALFHYHSVLELGLIPDVDHARDARSDGRNHTGLVGTEAYAVHFLVAVIAEAQYVSIARETLTYAVGKWKSLRLGP